MTLSTQLRIILLLVGVAICVAIYLFGRRRTRAASDLVDVEPEAIESASSFDEVAPLDEDELDTPAYMRRQGVREPRQDYEPRIANADDYVDDIAVHDEQYVDEVASPLYVEHASAAPIHDQPADAEPYFAIEPLPEFSRREPVVELPELTEPPTLPNIPVVAEPVPEQVVVRSERSPVTGPAIAPTLSMAVPAASGTRDMRDTQKPAARRKIIALRLPMPEGVSGTKLLALLQGERLEHGKFNIFHRMHEAGTVFSVASMVEPGSFNIDTMSEQSFPGVTLFMLLPGPLDGLVAYDQMMSCAQRLAHATGGSLHDERGNKLTVAAMERLREEVLDFQHLIGGL